MTKSLIIAGASGNLGSGVLKILLTKNYDNYFVFLRKGKTLPIMDERIVLIEINDLAIEEDVDSAFSRINPDKNTVFYLFSSIGGYMGGKPLWEYTVRELDKILNLNLLTSFLLCKYFAKLVQQSLGGSICLTSALISIKPEQNKSLYGLSKSALNSMIKTFALEGRSINLSANVIAPYIIDSPENREWVKDTSTLITPEEIGEVVHSLFNEYRVFSGNIVELKQKLNILNSTN